MGGGDDISMRRREKEWKFIDWICPDKDTDKIHS
jgi:hypothetical protein